MSQRGKQALSDDDPGSRLEAWSHRSVLLEEKGEPGLPCFSHENWLWWWLKGPALSKRVDPLLSADLNT